MLRLSDLKHYERIKYSDDLDSGLGRDSPPPSPGGVEWGNAATAAAATAIEEDDIDSGIDSPPLSPGFECGSSAATAAAAMAETTTGELIIAH